MTVDDTHTWTPEWANNVTRAARSQGFRDVTDLLAAMPNLTYSEIAAFLGNHFAPIQIVSVQYQEASSAGTVRDAAKDALSRNIMAKLPGGYGGGENPEFKWIAALAAWGSELQVTGGHSELKSTIHCIQDKLRPPVGWKPIGPNDPLIVAAFDDCWPDSKQKSH